jgi:hypothetical protein
MAAFTILARSIPLMVTTKSLALAANQGISIADGSILDTGNGNDRISGNGNIGTGIYNGSITFNTGDGNDTIEGSGGSYGIYNKDL